MDANNTRREFIGKAGSAAGIAALAVALGAGDAGGTETVALNAMQPTPEQIQAFMKLPQDSPVVMVNLLKYKDRSEYEKYGIGVSKILSQIGAEILFAGDCKMTLIGGAEWDSVALVRYPNAQSLIKMGQSPEFQAIHHHREAGLEGQINLAVFETGMVAGQASDGSGEVTADQIMSRMDTNGDGMIDMEEAPEQLKGAFGMVDANGDGGIDLSEAQTIANFANGQ